MPQLSESVGMETEVVQGSRGWTVPQRKYAKSEIGPGRGTVRALSCLPACCDERPLFGGSSIVRNVLSIF